MSESTNIPPAFLRPDQAAAYIGISRRHLCELTRRGLIPAARMGRKLTLYSRKELEAAIERRSTGVVK